MGKKIYTKEQIDYIKRESFNLHPKEIAKTLGIKPQGVRYIQLKENINLRENGTRSRLWSKEELKILSNKNLTDYQKTKLLQKRTYASVRRARRRMGFNSKMITFNRQFVSEGYKYIRCPNGYIKNSRLVVENKINRKLTSKDIVHHINGDKSDDRPENLCVCLRSKHNEFHSQAFSIIKQLMKNNYVSFDEKIGYILNQTLEVKDET